MALTWASATSRTSTTQRLRSGTTEKRRSMRLAATSALEQGLRRIIGPMTKEGLMVASSRPRPSGCPSLMKAHAARSARVLDSG